MSDLLTLPPTLPGLELELRTDTQYATAYLHGRPIATVQRRRVIGEAHLPVWRVYQTDGILFGACRTPRFAVSLVTQLAKALS